MTPKMVSSFRRSLSFSHPKDTTKRTTSQVSHVRSTSLPCRSHPLLSQLKDHLNHLKSSWAAAGSNPVSRTSAWLCDGLAQLKTVHDYLDDILHLPQTQESLRRQPDWVDQLLEDFLRFVDAYGIFQTLVFGLKQQHSAAQVAVRRRKDESKIEVYAKAVRKMEKEMGVLVSTIRCITRINSSNTLIFNVDAELVEAILDVKEVTVLVSTVLFSGISLSFMSKKRSWMRLRRKGKVEEGVQEFKQVGTEYCCLWGLRKKEDEEMRMVLKRMNELEDCIVKIEMGSERVFRSLLNSRVALLNVLTK
ncbi:hypothetical protein Vadar_019753 [Vaccinium darrowii]|uniref:Uncharacterized protein n=1 Tax=Vaccinium darrowii TaxID=229202 RepID=A0ACB7Y1P9_9ERIC|nr:hypothetical protein Vadar_019753 [Vaccinium darrowii]